MSEGNMIFLGEINPHIFQTFMQSKFYYTEQQMIIQNASIFNNFSKVSFLIVSLCFQKFELNIVKLILKHKENLNDWIFLTSSYLSTSYGHIKILLYSYLWNKKNPQISEEVIHDLFPWRHDFLSPGHVTL